MKSKRLILTYIAVCLFLILSNASLGLNPLKKVIASTQTKTTNQATQCPNALLYEYFSSSPLPLKDVSKLPTGQFSGNTLNDINGPDNIYLRQLSYKTMMLSEDQSVSYLNPLKAHVSNGQLGVVVTYKIIVTDGKYRKKNVTYTGNSTFKGVGIAYDKEFNVVNGASVIDNVTVNVNYKDIVSAFNDTKIDSTDVGRMTLAITGNGATKDPSLWKTITQLLKADDIKTAMRKNAQGQHLSKTYPQNPYIYRSWDANITVDVTTVTTSSQLGDLSNGIAAKLPSSNNHCPTFVPNFTNTGASMYISKQLIQNFVQYNIQTYAGWSNKVFDKSVASDLLQYYLSDLQYIVDGLYYDMGPYMGNPLTFSCSAKENSNTQLDPQDSKVLQTILWACEGVVNVEGQYRKVVEFWPRIKYYVYLGISSQGYLDVNSDKLEFVDCQFKDVPTADGQAVYKVPAGASQKLAQLYIQSVFNQMRTHPIGANFKISPTGKSLKIEQGLNGVWIL